MIYRLDFSMTFQDEIDPNVEGVLLSFQRKGESSIDIIGDGISAVLTVSSE